MVTNARKVLFVWLTLRSTRRQMNYAFAQQPWKCCKRMSCLQTEIQSYANSTPFLTAMCTEETKRKTIHYQQYALRRFQGDIKQTYRFPCVQVSNKPKLHKQQQQRHWDLKTVCSTSSLHWGKLNHSGCTRANSCSFSPNLSVEKAFDECRVYYRRDLRQISTWLGSLQILIIRTKKVIIMNILKVEMIAREINYKEGSQFFPSNFRSTWNVRSLQSILTLILLKSTEHILHLQVSPLFLR